MGAYIFERMAVLGVGLMGSSLASALKAAGGVGHVTGWGRNPDNLMLAQQENIIDDWSLELDEALKGCDCVVVATPTQYSEQILIEVVRQCDRNVAITDVASVKGNLVAALRKEFGVVPANVVLGHPIAGSEKSGVTACDRNLYKNHNVILVDVEVADKAILSAINEMWRIVGANVSVMASDQHDEVLAMTSHLPHMLSYSLVSQIANSCYEKDIFEYAAGGFKDFTRIAGSDAVMWAEICLANRTQIVAGVDGYVQTLAKIKAAIENNDRDTLLQTFAEAKEHRDAFLEAYEARIEGRNND